jgi:hypothetical protein
VRAQAEVALEPLRRRLIIGACANNDRGLLAKVADKDVDALLKPAQMVHDRADILTDWNLNADLGDLLPAANRGVADGIRGEFLVRDDEPRLVGGPNERLGEPDLLDDAVLTGVRHPVAKPDGLRDRDQ